MINETPQRLNEYSARLKLRLDEAARFEFARDEGRKEGLAKGRQEGRQIGRQEGEVIGRIVTLQDLLGFTEPSRSELFGSEMPQLNELAEQLRLQLHTRGQ